MRFIFRLMKSKEIGNFKWKNNKIISYRQIITIKIHKINKNSYLGPGDSDFFRFQVIMHNF